MSDSNRNHRIIKGLLSRRLIDGNWEPFPLPANSVESNYTIAPFSGSNQFSKILQTSDGYKKILQGIPITAEILEQLREDAEARERARSAEQSALRRDIQREIDKAIAQLHTLRTTTLPARETWARGFEEVGLLTAAYQSVGGALSLDVLLEFLKDVAQSVVALTVPTTSAEEFAARLATWDMDDYSEIYRTHAVALSWAKPFSGRVGELVSAWQGSLRRGNIPGFVSDMQGLISRVTQEANVRPTNSWHGIYFTYPDDEDYEQVDIAINLLVQFRRHFRVGGASRLNCGRVIAEIARMLDEELKVELVISKCRAPLFPGPRSGRYQNSNFSLHAPVSEDTCPIKRSYSNITTGVQTAKAVGEYRLYVDPSLKFPPGYSGTTWPIKDLENPAPYNAQWNTILEHERNLNETHNTYYGDLSTKNKGSFPRYAGLTIPTYQAGSFGDLFKRSHGQDRIFPAIVQRMSPEFARDIQMRFKYYTIENGTEGWSAYHREEMPIEYLQLAPLLEALGNGNLQDLPDLFGIRPENQNGGGGNGACPEGEVGSLVQTPPLPPPWPARFVWECAPPQECSPFRARILAALAAEADAELSQNLINDQFKSPNGLFLGMLNGELDYTEPLFYKITREKVLPWEFGAVGHRMTKGGIPILGGQHVFKLNDSGKSEFTFEDRFVDYGDAYQYNVEAYTITTRVDYQTWDVSRDERACLITSAQSDQINLALGDIPGDITYTLVGFKGNFDVHKLPYLHTDYLDKAQPPRHRSGVSLPPVLITDLPPIAPGVNIIPYRGVEDKMLFLFDLQTDRVVQRYIYLNDEEKQHFEGIHNQQKITFCDLPTGGVEFQSEGGDVEKFQIFRTTITPEAVVGDNQSSMYQAAFGDEPYKEIMQANGSSLIDDIVPNTKYFYMFRTKDRNGHISNPSAIYRVEMVSEDGLIFPIIEAYIPKLPKQETKYRKFAKYLEVKPSLLMSEPNWSAGDDNNISWRIGSRGEETVFDQKFLIRLTSIDTGRKVDLKVSFTNKKEKVEVTDDRDVGE